MRRPRKFLSLILILLLINVIFFSVWYAFGGRDWFRNYLTDTVGKLIDAEITLGDLHISDKQIYLQDLHFATSDSLISLDVESVRVRYNLYKFIFSRFKISGVVGSIEIIKPEAHFSYRVEQKESRASSSRGEFEIPDLSGYFKRLSLVQGSISTDLAIPLKIVNMGDLFIEEKLSDINLTVRNSSVTNISLKAKTSMGGSINFEGSLDDGRIDLAEAEITSFRPLYIVHPDIRDFRSEINVSASYRVPLGAVEPVYSAKSLIWNSTAKVLDEYRVSIPLITSELESNNLSVRIVRSNLGSSSFEADIRIADLGKEMSFDGSSLITDFDLSMIMPELSGYVHAQALASGNINNPLVLLQAQSERLAYEQWACTDIAINARYEDDIAKLTNADAIWENQSIRLNAEFDPHLMSITALLQTDALDTFGQEYYAQGSLELEGLIVRPIPMFEARLKDFTIAYGDAVLEQVNGYARMIPLEEALLVDAKISANDSFDISVTGDLMQEQILLDARFRDISVTDFYASDSIEGLAPVVSGKISALMLDRKIRTHSEIGIAMEGDIPFNGNLDILGSVDLRDFSAMASVRSDQSYFNNNPVEFEISAHYADDRLNIFGLRIKDLLNLSGAVNLKDWQDMNFDLAIYDLTMAKLGQLNPDLLLMIPEFSALSFFAKYNRANERRLEAWMNLREIDLLSVIPLDLDLRLDGMPEDINIAGSIKANTLELIGLKGTASLLPEIKLSLETAIQDLQMENVLTQPPGEASISGTAGVTIMDLLADDRAIEFAADLSAEAIRFGDFEINRANVRLAQQADALVVDSLWISSDKLFSASAKGSLGYNIITGEFFDGERSLDLAIEGQLFPWLKELSDYIVDSRGVSKIRLSIGNDDEQFVVNSGELDIHSGYVMLQDQVEALRNIELKGAFENNRFVLERGQFNMGNGRFYMNNVFDAEPSDHFMIAFLDLGYLRLMIEEPGIQATIPVVAPPKTLSNIALKGQRSRFATIRGPFDDMKIEAHVTASNLDILFPPGADNLLNLILSVRSTGRKPESDPVPLPFQLDLFVNIGENVRYVTYPTNLNLKPGGFLHLLYDGSAFIVKEVFITSDRGRVDFFGTVFQVDNIAISMIDQQDIMNVEGLFYKRTPDGSTISLNVRSTPDFDKSLLDRLEISLTSDNPQDRNITQVLSRLRYNQAVEDLPNEQRQNLLQDEALGLIGGNLNSTVLTPFFYPAENWIRRTFKLDSFSINAGFIQNLFTEYSSDPSQLADLADLSNFGSDISRFSSSILLNNLSLSMSKYLGYRFFMDYELGLQEATDLQKKTRIMVSHDTSLRLVLPKNYRMGYTFRYEPKEAGITHEIMIQRTLRFWGL